MLTDSFIELLEGIDQDTFTKKDILNIITQTQKRNILSQLEDNGVTADPKLRTLTLPQLESNGVVIDPKLRKLKFNGKSVSLAPQMFNLLYYMIENKNMILPKKVIMRDLWKKDTKVNERIIDMHISVIRKALDASLIETVVGYGYMWVEK
jgi:DNA-binding response OmpR family regulator